MFVAFSYLPVPFKTSERPVLHRIMPFRVNTRKQLKVVLLSVCRAFPVVVKSFEVARGHRPPVVVSFRGNKNGEVTGYA